MGPFQLLLETPSVDQTDPLLVQAKSKGSWKHTGIAPKLSWSRYVSIHLWSVKQCHLSLDICGSVDVPLATCVGSVGPLTSGMSPLQHIPAKSSPLTPHWAEYFRDSLNGMANESQWPAEPEKVGPVPWEAEVVDGHACANTQRRPGFLLRCRLKWSHKTDFIVHHYTEVTWASLRLKSPATRHFVQQFDQGKGNINAPFSLAISDEIPSQMPCDAEKVSMSWRHHVSLHPSRIVNGRNSIMFQKFLIYHPCNR